MLVQNKDFYHDNVKKKVHLDDMRCAGLHKVLQSLLSTAQQPAVAVCTVPSIVENSSVKQIVQNAATWCYLDLVLLKKRRNATSTFSALASNVYSVQVCILSGQLCNVNSIFLMFTMQSSRQLPL